jgi:hypothetical protein
MIVHLVGEGMKFLASPLYQTSTRADPRSTVRLLVSFWGEAEWARRATRLPAIAPAYCHLSSFI